LSGSLPTAFGAAFHAERWRNGSATPGRDPLRQIDKGDLMSKRVLVIHINERNLTDPQGPAASSLSGLGEAQIFLTPNVFVKLNNAVGLTSKAPDWAPEVGLVFSFPRR